jgi:hypothetical protein
MLKLDATTKSLEIRLAGPVATAECPFYVSYVEADQTTAALTAFAARDGTTAGATAVSVMPAPAAGRTRKLDYLSLVNRDTAAVIVTVQVTVSGTPRPVQGVTLAVGDNLSFTDAGGWRVLDAFGQERFAMGALPAHHLTHESGGADAVTLAQSQVTGLTSALATKVDTTGTPAANQLALFTDADTVKGDPALTFDPTLSLTVKSAGGFPSLNLVDTAQAVDQRQFTLINGIGSLFIRATNDAGGTMATALSINRAGLVALSSGQLQFPVTQNPSADANTLDDYREGTWMPTVTGSTGSSGTTYSLQAGNYCKKGREVKVAGRIGLSLVGTISGNLRLANFAFPFAAGTNMEGVLIHYFALLTQNIVAIRAMGVAGITQADVLILTAAAGSMTNATTALLGNSSGLAFSCTYLTDN